jgi:hypothetical protein
MTWKRVGVYYALCVILGGYFFLVEKRPKSERPLLVSETRTAQQSRFLPITRNDIQEVILRRNTGTLTCRRNGQAWQVVEPPGVQVPPDLLASFVENLTPEKEVQVINEAAKDLSAYGLDRPSSTIVIKGAQNAPVATVFLGDRNPTSSAVYARKENSSQVVLLGYSVKYYEDLIFEQSGVGKK